MIAEFWDDLKKALGAWRTSPVLPLMTVLLQLPFALQKVHPVWGLMLLPFAIFYGGFVGTERVWYLRTWNGEGMTARQVWSSAWFYFGPYLALAVLVAVPYLLLSVVIGLVVNGLFDLDAESARVINLALLAIVTDVLLTFMTPALAFSTRSAREAIKIGWKFLRGQGRHVALYALTPPLVALALLQRTPSTTLSGGPRLALAILGSLVYLAMKGATAAKYLRHHEVQDEALPPSIRGSGVHAPPSGPLGQPVH